MEFDAVYTALEEQSLRTAERTGQRCAPGCGACCRRPTREIESSAAELLPLARRLWESGQAPALLDKARAAGAEGWCVLYEPGGDGPYPLGRCGHYANRPLTCRLFGFAAVPDQKGKPRPLLSPVMKARDPDLVLRFDQAVEEGAQPPLAAEWRFRLVAADPEAGDLLPLNEALVRALEQEGLRRRFHS